VVSGPEKECSEAIQRLEVIADTYLSVSTAVQHMLPRLLNNPEAITENILARTRSNYESLKANYATGSLATLFRCEGGWNAVLRMPGSKTDNEWALEFLANRGVLTHPGHLFDFGIRSCIVVSLLPEKGVFEEGIKRIIDAVA
jgi:hypothetical protein